MKTLKSIPEALAVSKLKICQMCGFPHWTVSQTISGTCASCRYFESTRRDRKNIATAIKFLRAKGVCAYCGEGATDVEHVIPRVSSLPTYTVPSCSECNNIAGALLFPSFHSKLLYIQEKIRRRYRHVLRVPEWTTDEIEEMGQSMRTMILAFQRARKWVKRRVEWDIAEVIVQAELSDPEHGSTPNDAQEAAP